MPDSGARNPISDLGQIDIALYLFSGLGIATVCSLGLVSFGHGLGQAFFTVLVAAFLAAGVCLLALAWRESFRRMRAVEAVIRRETSRHESGGPSPRCWRCSNRMSPDTALRGAWVCDSCGAREAMAIWPFGAKKPLVRKR